MLLIDFQRFLGQWFGCKLLVKASNVSNDKVGIVSEAGGNSN